MSRFKLSFLSLALAILACSLLAVPAFADSQVRIVRLSQVDGAMQIDRNTGQGYERAFLNLPITEGAKLKAGAEGRAEVEFEDGSTLRLTPDTVVEFPQLSLRDSGASVSTVNVVQGTAYVNFTASKNDEFTLHFGRETLGLSKASHLRIEVGDTEATVAIFSGEAQVEGPAGTLEIAKKQTARFDFANKDESTVAKNLEENPFDQWDKEQDKYHQRYSASNSYSPYGYGVSDLSYYGSFFDAPGYGRCWQPYFTGVGWDPFMNGAWYWYPGFGYTWVSGYPWGWMPYRYGSWAFLPAYGWAWQPGTSWAAWRTVPPVLSSPQRFTPPQPPASPGRTVAVNRGPAPVMTGRSFNRMTIRNDSAGLGIPRGAVRDLGRVSQKVEQKGVVTQSLRTTPMQTGVSAARPADTWSRTSGAGAAQQRGSSARTTSAPTHSSAPAVHSAPPARSAPAPAQSVPHR
jgi:hypothetical protein